MILNFLACGKFSNVLTADCILVHWLTGELNLRPPSSKTIKSKGRNLTMPEMHYVDSSNIEAIGYDSSTQELHVLFLKSGETYVYYDVEEWVFQEFLHADSKGTYLNTKIKPSYRYAKL